MQIPLYCCRFTGYNCQQKDKRYQLEMLDKYKFLDLLWTLLTHTFCWWPTVANLGWVLGDGVLSGNRKLWTQGTLPWMCLITCIGYNFCFIFSSARQGSRYNFLPCHKCHVFALSRGYIIINRLYTWAMALFLHKSHLAWGRGGSFNYYNIGLEGLNVADY